MSNLRLWWQARNLQSDNAEARLRAIERLGLSTDADAAAHLLQAIADPEPGVRAAAATALGKRGDAGATDPLISLLLHEKCPEVVAATEQALVELGDPRTASRLYRELDDPDPTARQNAASALRRVAWEHLNGTQRVHVAILQNAWDEVPTYGAEAVEPLAQALRTGTPRLKRDAAEALGTVGLPAAMQAMVEVLSDGQLDRATRQTAAWALRKYYADDLKDPHWGFVCVVEGEWTDIVRLGAAALEALRTGLADPDLETRRHCLETIGQLDRPECRGIVTGVLADCEQNIEVREAAARALAGRATPAGVATLVTALSDGAWRVRQAAAAALKELNWTPRTDRERALIAVAERRWGDAVALGSAAIEALVGALPFSTIGLHAAKALVGIGPAGIAALTARLREPGESDAVREVVAKALGEIGDRAALEPVLAMLKDRDMAVRQTAVWTLERLGWQPDDDRQRVIAAIAHDDWEAVARCGPAAIEALLTMADDGMAPHETIRVLRRLLETSSAALSIKQLQELGALKDIPVGGGAGGRVAAAVGTHVDCAKVRELARQELVRRGLMS